MVRNTSIREIWYLRIAMRTIPALGSDRSDFRSPANGNVLCIVIVSVHMERLISMESGRTETQDC
jgi:hypothetical protein